MRNHKEVNRRIMSNEESENKCDPLAIDAEIVIEEEGGTVYLHAQWVSEVPDELLLEATTESVYEINKKLNSGEGDFDTLVNQINGIVEKRIEGDYAKVSYNEQFDELEKMVIDFIKSTDLYKMTFEDYEEDGVFQFSRVFLSDIAV